MIIFKLERSSVDEVDYDEVAGFVVVAKSEQAARQFAMQERGDEAGACWLSSKNSTCKRIGVASRRSDEGVILRDYRAG